MKGTLFSADFIEDKNGELRLIEINTDTAPPKDNLSFFDYTDLISVLSNNNINSFTVINKPNLHKDLVDHLSSSLSVSASFISEFIKIDEHPNTIYTTAVEDAENKFILRMAYDESAIFDSEYTKGTLNLLSLFYTAGESGSVVEFYHSSSLGEFNSLLGAHNTSDTNLNPQNLPDLVVKNIYEDHKLAKFYKIGSESENESEENRLEIFINQVKSENKIIEKYHINNSTLNDNKTNSIRSFSITYGQNLDLINIAQYKTQAIFYLPSGSIHDNSVYVNELDIKHYYEFATNYVKFEGLFDGILDRHLLIKGDDTEIAAGLVNVGDTLKSYYIGTSSTNEETFDYLNWQITGNTFPTDSYLTSSVVIYKNTKQLEKKTLVNLTVNDNEDSIFVATNKSFLVYDSGSNVIKWRAALNIDPDTDYLLDFDGSLARVTENEFFVTNENDLTLVEIDCEETDTYIIAGTTPVNSFITHNAPCFVAGTIIKLSDGGHKNIEDIQSGDIVCTYDFESEKMTENVVNAVFSKKVNQTVKYVFDNGDEIECTLDHPIYVNSKGWSCYNPEMSKEMYNLKPQKIEVGDNIKLFNGSTKILEINTVEKDVMVYNLQDIENNHNFFANNILVHNRFCFVGGTEITLQNGEIKNIEDVEVGDFVLSYNENTKQQEYNKVIKLYNPIHDDLVEYELFDGKKITSTHDHPFYINDFFIASYKPELTKKKYEKFSNVLEIKVGDFLNTVDNEKISILNITEKPKLPTETYIFTVENNNNFYANGVLVHNK